MGSTAALCRSTLSVVGLLALVLMVRGDGSPKAASFVSESLALCRAVETSAGTEWLLCWSTDMVFRCDVVGLVSVKGLLWLDLELSVREPKPLLELLEDSELTEV